ncbi:acyl--CoA ligase [Mesorhizobium sp. YC-39]|uniref:class I adenylate-forming enzyme family protein n=1 Tax=unclassified Mesorhizobium TaxID=325217 RepID=UPI0021E7F350|nr:MULTISPECIES: class I adenylate-forming enzyme family protein [unclassified Mesorhizobium]MCV3210823.1 acyl--CoA ligase [Mesorhizobium sp. YC-2]MCV3231057.1 acyl--CoA ligase [Mesorhizobium sp. YC-39]
MGRTDVLAEPVPDYAERRRRIEAEPLPVNLQALIDEAALEAGDRLLWDFFESGETITYARMRRTVNGLAGKLLDAGIVKGTHVGVMLPNIAAMPLTWLALGCIGAIMAPVNVSYRERELAHVVKSAGVDWMVVHKDCLPIVAEANARGLIAIAQKRIIVVGGAAAPMLSWETLAAEPRDQFEAPQPVGHDDLLNIQFTSGTSGFPKGCMLTQRYWISSGKVNAFRDGRRYERILASTPFFYMDPQWLLLMTIYQRGTLFVAARQSTSRFMEWIRRYRIQFCLLPWVLHSQPDNPLDAKNEIVRANVYGVPRDLHAKLEARYDLNAREAFGMTELGPAMFMPVERSDMVGSGSCGVPCPFRECKIVDEEGREVGAGEVGELLVRGPGIMLGYYNNPEATASVFADGWFKTGDLFRVDEQGHFYIVGRKKDMIRRSAENIAAREVESVLNAVPVVAEAAVIGVPDPLRGEEVKAYIKLKDGFEPSEEIIASIIDKAGRELAPFKVPRFYAFLADFPRTASLKIAKPQLAAETADLRTGSYDRVENRWIGSPQ